MQETPEFLTNMILFLIGFTLFAASLGYLSYSAGKSQGKEMTETTKIIKETTSVIIKSFFPSIEKYQSATTKQKKFLAIFGFLNPTFNFEQILDELKIIEKYPRAEIIFPIIRLALFITFFIGISLLISLFHYDLPIINTTGDISNSATLIIEIGIAVFLGLALLVYSNVDQKQIKNIMRKNQDTLDVTTSILQKIELMENVQYTRLKKEDIKIEKKQKDAYLELEIKLSHLSIVKTLLDNWDAFDELEINLKKVKINFIEKLLVDAHAEFIVILKQHLDLLDDDQNSSIISISSMFDKLLIPAITDFNERNSWEKLWELLKLYYITIPSRYRKLSNEDGMKSLMKYFLLNEKT